MTTNSAAPFDIDHCLDIFGQQPRLGIHTQVCLCYPLPPDVAIQALLDTLSRGLERLTASFPWVAGQVMNEGSHGVNSGIFKIKPLKETPQLVFRDLTRDAWAPTWERLKDANFSMTLLDESIFASRPTFPPATHSPGSEPDSPVLMMQVNLLRGGIVLTFLGQHQCMDITGQSQLMRLLSKACHDHTFTADELSIGNIERRSILPRLENYNQGPELARHLVRRNLQKEDCSGQATPHCCWSSFVVSPGALALLKHTASQSLPAGSSYVSTDDSLSAFLWQSILRARSSRLAPRTLTTFARAVDARRFVDIPAMYMGIVQNMTYTAHTLSDLLSLPLGHVASELRDAVDPRTTDLPYRTRALATHLYDQEDKSKVSPVASLDPSVDVIISSWANTDCYKLDFNLGFGPPEAVRRPNFTPLESFVYLLPKRADGEVGVALCLRPDDLETLKTDEQFLQHVKFCG